MLIIAGTVSLLIYLVRKGSRHTYRPSIPDRWPDLPPAPPPDLAPVGYTRPPTSPPNHEARTALVPVPEFVATRIREGSFEGIRCPNCNQQDLTVEVFPPDDPLFHDPFFHADGSVSYELWCPACMWVDLTPGPPPPAAPQADDQNYPLDMHLKFDATYDPDADASYIDLASDRANGDAVRQQHVDCDGSDGQIILDYDRDGRLLGIEFLGASSLLTVSALSPIEQPETGP